MRLTRDWLVALLILAAALTTRLSYYGEYSRVQEFSYPTVDALYHHQAAALIADGVLTSAEPFFRAPLYNYFLGGIYAVFGQSIPTARLLQLLLGALTPFLVFLLARQMLERWTAILAAALTLLCWDIVYFQGELLLESLLMLLLLAAWLSAAGYLKRRSLILAALTGTAIGLAVITRLNAVVIFPVTLYLFLSKGEGNAGSRSPRAGIIILAVTFALPVALVLSHNLTRAEPALTIATQGGINFYIGNNRSADGVSAVMPGKLGYDWQFEDVEYLAEQHTRRDLSPAQVSSYYYQEGFSEITADPLAWMSLAVKKAYLFFGAKPLSNNRNLTAFRERFTVLKLLPVSMWLLAPLGIVGAVVCWPRDRLMRGLAVFQVLYFATFLFFFVNSRFRLPLLPFLAISSGCLVAYARHWLTDHSRRPLIIATMAVLGLLILFSANLYRVEAGNDAQAQYAQGNLLLKKGANREAIESYRTALSSDYDLARVRLNLGVAFLRLGEVDSARKYFNLENSAQAGSPEALNNLAYLARREGDLQSAVEALAGSLRGSRRRVGRGQHPEETAQPRKHAPGQEGNRHKGILDAEHGKQREDHQEDQEASAAHPGPRAIRQAERLPVRE
jgi:4-amino-4-deoxy-L-arabinose transferase-like glycosyltransferase